MAVDYPSSLPSPQFNGFSATQSQNYYLTEMDYATKRRPKPTGNFIVNFKLILSETDLGLFNGWYYKDLSAGAKLFQATWNVAGIFQLLEFGFAEGGQPKYTPVSPTHYQVDLKVEVKTDIYELLENNNLNGFCPDIIACQEATINFAVNYTAS